MLLIVFCGCSVALEIIFCVKGLEEYKQQVKRISALALPLKDRIDPFSSRSFARVGLMGNPSDGFFGKTISMSISNFWAEVTIVESEKLVCHHLHAYLASSDCCISYYDIQSLIVQVLTPHKLNDPTQFGGLSDLHWISRKEG